MPFRVKILGRIWLGYFLLTIAVVGFSFATVLFFPVRLLSRFLPGLEKWPDHILQMGIRLLLLLQPWLKARVALDLPENEHGVLLVSNHRSHLDVFILLSRVPGIRIMARKNLFRIPFLSLMMKATRQIGVERGSLEAWSQAMETLRERLTKGERVHVFPELTRCEPGFAGVRNFASGPFLAAIQKDSTVLPIVIKNTDAVWPKGQVGLHFRPSVEVISLAPIRARDFSSADILRREVHSRIAEALA
ncbi:MAG: lysophospholipid acyltransferase family protein [Bdellovibrionales bacterium]